MSWQETRKRALAGMIPEVVRELEGVAENLARKAIAADEAEAQRQREWEEQRVNAGSNFPRGEARTGEIGVAMSTGMASPLMVELACQLIGDGHLCKMVDWQRTENATRLSILREFPLLSQAKGSATSAHVWLTLPEAWRAEDLVEHAARDHGVSIAPTHTFVVGRRHVPHAVRFVIGAPENQDQLYLACDRLEGLIRHDPRPSVEKG